MVEEGSKTILLHRGFTESIKKHAEDNKAHKKRHSEGGGYSLKTQERQVTVRNTG